MIPKDGYGQEILTESDGYYSFYKSQEETHTSQSPENAHESEKVLRRIQTLHYSPYINIMNGAFHLTMNLKLIRKGIQSKAICKVTGQHRTQNSMVISGKVNATKPAPDRCHKILKMTMMIFGGIILLLLFHFKYQIVISIYCRYGFNTENLEKCISHTHHHYWKFIIFPF